MQPSKNASVGDVFRIKSSPYEAETSPEMGHFIREARRFTRNNTFIGMDATKGEGIHLNLTKSLNRSCSAENLSVNRLDRNGHNKAHLGESMSTIAPLKPEQFANSSEVADDECSGTREKPPNDRRCSMIPLMCQSVVRPKISHASSEKDKVIRKKPPIPPKHLAKHQDPIKIYRAERLQEKKVDMEQQMKELREQVAGAELNRQKDDQHNRELIELLKGEINDLKSTCDKLTEAVQRLQNSDDLFLKMKHEGEFSFYSRSYEVSKKILSNTFRRRRSNSARASSFEPCAGTSRDTGGNFDNSDQYTLSDNGTNTLKAHEEPGVSSGRGADHKLCRANSAPDPPMNVVTSLYYVSEIQSLEMDDGSQERNDTGNPSLQTSEKEMITKKKTRMSKFGGWFKPGKR
uniref:Uncharacterized protein n=1 Tax=Anopheles minimus TaxID=112268 RepID=A0A182W9Q2_9DIPT